MQIRIMPIKNLTTKPSHILQNIHLFYWPYIESCNNPSHSATMKTKVCWIWTSIMATSLSQFSLKELHGQITKNNICFKMSNIPSCNKVIFSFCFSLLLWSRRKVYHILHPIFGCNFSTISPRGIIVLFLHRWFCG